LAYGSELTLTSLLLGNELRIVQSRETWKNNRRLVFLFILPTSKEQKLLLDTV